jgi:hypothetical protein
MKRPELKRELVVEEILVRSIFVDAYTTAACRFMNGLGEYGHVSRLYKIGKRGRHFIIRVYPAYDLDEVVEYINAYPDVD